jgi:hypothetical protein
MVIYRAFASVDKVEIDTLKLSNKKDVVQALNSAAESDNDLYHTAGRGYMYAVTRQQIWDEIKDLFEYWEISLSDVEITYV